MKRYKTDDLIIHIVLKERKEQGQTMIGIEIGKTGEYTKPVPTYIPTHIIKQAIDDGSLTKHILNFFIKN